ncbi:MAG: CvpA family protein [Candidatus Sericytochromatia bacterium]|nr:CvpA family protein [Candidatus Tanganyikabacteria bacterium]
MSGLDAVAVAVLGYNCLRGLASGLVRTACGLAAVVVASVVAIYNPTWGRPLVDPFFEPGSLVSGIMQPVAIWAVTFFTINGLGILARMAIRKTFLRHVDQIGGAAFGFVAGAIILIVPIVTVSQLPLLKDVRPIQAELDRSLFVSALRPLAEALSPSVGK